VKLTKIISHTTQTLAEEKPKTKAKTLANSCPFSPESETI
jgi:hypothetical protein